MSSTLENGVFSPSLQAWMNSYLLNQEDNIFYKQHGIEQAVFIRDYVHPVLAPKPDGAATTWWKQNCVRVVGTHTSKSVLLPVYLIQTPNLKMIMRGDFHNWVVSVDSSKPVADVFLTLFDREKTVSRDLCEGFQEQWIFGSYSERADKFTVILPDQYALWTFCYLLKAS